MGTVAPYGISAHASRAPDKPALVLGDRVRTYGELDERSTRLAHALRSCGVHEGDRVAALLPNGFEFFEVGVAASKLSAVVIPVNWHLKHEELTWILADSAASVLVADESLSGAYTPALAALPGCRLLTVGAAGVYEDVIAAAAGAEPMEAGASAAPMFYTSGTTGRPKGVVHAGLDAERAQAAQIGLVQLWGVRDEDVYALSGPAYHAGPGGYANTALFAGGTVVILESWDARGWLALVDRHRVTWSFMVPAHFIRILEVPDAERGSFDLSSLRLIIHGAAPCPVEVKRRVMEALAPAEIWELYGMSEGGATRISPDEWRRRPGSVGTPWPGVEVTIRDRDGAPLAAGATGLIHVRPAGGARFRYHNDDAKTADAWRDGAFTVGDVGHVDDDGYLYVTDRATDMVIRGGVNVYPREIEEVLYSHPSIVDCAVFGVPDERMGEELVAMVEVRAPVDPAELQAHCGAHLASFKCPRTVEVVETLPRDPNGKVLKRVLRDRARRQMRHGEA
jgi:long-chain acyl-CoA synthetase